MASITLYEYTYGGIEKTFEACTIDADAAVDAGYMTHTDTHKTNPHTGKDQKFMAGSISGAGLQMIAGICSFAECMLPVQTDFEYDPDTDTYTQTGTFTAQTVGVKPDDWDARCIDSYYTQTTVVIGGTTRIYYTPNGTAAWDDNEQYYKNTQIMKTWYTRAGGWFGASRGCWRPSGGTFTATGGFFTNSITNITWSYSRWLMPHFYGTDSAVSNLMDAVGIGRSPNEYGPILQPIAFMYDGAQWLGFASIRYDSGGLISGCDYWVTEPSWFEGLPVPGEAGDWGASSGAHKPDGTHSYTFNINGLTGIDTSLQQSSWGSSAAGLNVWITSDTEYGKLIEETWKGALYTLVINQGWKPGEYILAAHRVPEGYEVSGSKVYITCGGKVSRAQGYYANQRIYTVDCGSVYVPAVEGTYSDYGATAEIYLPFIGTIPLDIDKILRGTLHLYYRIDIITGDCTAIVTVLQGNPDGYSFPHQTTPLIVASGNCLFEVPVSRTDSAISQKLAGLGAAIAAGGAAATGNIPAAAAAAGVYAASVGQSAKAHAGATGLSGNARAFAHLRPYIWIKYPYPINPYQYTELHGRMSYMGGTAGAVYGEDITAPETVTGYTKYLDIDLEGIDATAEEKAEIEKLLKEGVYI